MSALFNPYAAVPSMHVAFALMIAWPLARLARHRDRRASLWLLYPLVMTFVIVVTANHFIVDAVLGALTAAVSAYGASWLARARPRRWRFSAVSPAPGGQRLSGGRADHGWHPPKQAPPRRAPRRAQARSAGAAPRAPIGSGRAARARCATA